MNACNHSVLNATTHACVVTCVTRIVGVDNCFTGVTRHGCAQVKACMCVLQFMYVEITQNARAVLSCTVYIYIYIYIYTRT